MTKIGDDVTEIMMLSCATKMRASFLAPGKFLSFSGTLRVRLSFLCAYCAHILPVGTLSPVLSLGMLFC